MANRFVFVRTPGQEAKLPLIPVRPQPWSLWIADAATGTAHQLWHSGDKLDDSLPGLSEDTSLNFADGRIVFSSEQDGRNHLYSIPASGGTPTLLTPGEFDVEDVTLTPDKKSVIFSSNQDDVDRRHLWRVSVSGGSPQEALTKGETMEWSPVVTADGKHILLSGFDRHRSGDAVPAHREWTRHDREAGARRVPLLLTRHPEAGDLQK